MTKRTCPFCPREGGRACAELRVNSVRRFTCGVLLWAQVSFGKSFSCTIQRGLSNGKSIWRIKIREERNQRSSLSLGPGLCEANRKDFQMSISSHLKCSLIRGGQRAPLPSLGKREFPSKPVNNLPVYSVHSCWTQIFNVLDYTAHQKQQENGNMKGNLLSSVVKKKAIKKTLSW